MSKEIADRFRKMADRIELNEGQPFGGVALIIPPQSEGAGGESSVELFKLDPTPDPAIFWGEITTKANDAVTMLQTQMRQQRAFR